jgi:hypothetical protein
LVDLHPSALVTGGRAVDTTARDQGRFIVGSGSSPAAMHHAATKRHRGGSAMLMPLILWGSLRHLKDKMASAVVLGEPCKRAYRLALAIPT